MKYIEYYWNLIHYVLYRWENAITDGFNKPFKLLLKKNTFLQNLYTKRGIDNPFKETDKMWKNPDGFNSVLSGIHMGGLIVWLEFSLLNFGQVCFRIPLYPYLIANTSHLILSGILMLVVAGILNYLLLFRNDKYLDYFKKFNRKYKHKKIHST